MAEFYGKQGGQATIDSSTDTSVSVTINTIDTTKSFLSFSSRVNSTNPGQGSVRGRIVDSTTLTFNIAATVGSGPTITIEWEVFEFSSGVSVQRGTLNSASAGNNDITISSVTTVQTFVIVTYSSTGLILDTNDLVSAEILNSTTLRLVANGTPGASHNLDWEVIDYAGCNVQLISAAINSASTTQTITQVKTANTLLISTSNSAAGGTYTAAIHYRISLTNSTTVTYERYTTGTSFNMRTQVIEFFDGTRVQQVLSTPGAATGTQSDTITSIEPSSSTVFNCGTCIGIMPANIADDDYGNMSWASVITSETNVDSIRDDPTLAATIGIQVVSFNTQKVACKVGAFNTTTAAAGNTVVVTGLGFAPKAIIFWWSGRTETTDTVGGASTKFGFGVATSSTSRRSVSLQSLDAAAAQTVDCVHRTDACINTLVNNATIAVDGLMDVQSFDVDGFTLVIDDAFVASLRIHYWAIGGSDIINVFTGETPVEAAGDVSTTGVGFRPDCLIFLSPASGNASGTSAVDSRIMFGAAVRQNPNDAVWAGGADDAQTTMFSGSHCLIGRSNVHMTNASRTAVNTRGNVTDWGDDGFTINYTEATAGREYQFLAIQGGIWNIGSLTTQTDTTTDIVASGLGFKPCGGLLVSACKTESTDNAATADVELSIGAFDSSLAQGAQAYRDRDNITDAQVTTAVEHDNVYINFNDADAIDGAMNIISIDEDGFTAEMTNADPSGNFIWYLTFGTNYRRNNFELLGVGH